MLLRGSYWRVVTRYSRQSRDSKNLSNLRAKHIKEESRAAYTSLRAKDLTIVRGVLRIFPATDVKWNLERHSA